MMVLLKVLLTPAPSNAAPDDARPAVDTAAGGRQSR